MTETTRIAGKTGRLPINAAKCANEAKVIFAHLAYFPPKKGSLPVFGGAEVGR